MRRFVVAAVLAVAFVIPAGVLADPIEDGLAANVATIQHYVDNYFGAQAKHPLTSTQEARLAHDLDTLAHNQRALAAYRADPVLPPVLAVDIGSAPLPNNAQPVDSTYGCPADFNAIGFRARYGFDIQAAFDKQITDLVRSDLGRWQKLVGPTFTQATANYYKQGDVTKQKAILAYFTGTVPFSQIAGYFGGWYPYLGCGVDLAALHDLGASR